MELRPVQPHRYICWIQHHSTTCNHHITRGCQRHSTCRRVPSQASHCNDSSFAKRLLTSHKGGSLRPSIGQKEFDDIVYCIDVRPSLGTWICGMFNGVQSDTVRKVVTTLD